MRRASLLLGGAACAAAFAAHVAPSEASCIATLNWRTYTYTGTQNNVPGVKIGAELPERAKQPSCNDVIVNGYVPPVTYSDAPVAQIEGVPPSIAVAGGPSVIYVNQGTFPILKSHPLHGRIAAIAWPDITGPSCQIKGPAEINATGLYVNGFKVVVNARTKVELQRHGTAFIPPGTMLRVGGSECGTRFDQKVIEARRIARA